jgi:hypothetical protein
MHSAGLRITPFYAELRACVMFARALKFSPTFGAARSFSQAAKSQAETAQTATAHASGGFKPKAVKPKAVVSPTLIQVRKKNLKQSPLRMKFLAMLIRDRWLPDALAQLKFSPKHRAVDLAKMVKVTEDFRPAFWQAFSCLC